MAATGRCGRDACVPDKDSGARGKEPWPPDSSSPPLKDTGPSGAVSPGYQRDFQFLILTHVAFHYPPQERNTDTHCEL